MKGWTLRNMIPDNHIPLGKSVGHSRQYNPGHLFPVKREEGRMALGITGKLPFSGTDIWNAYEISWLNPKGKPCVAIGEFRFPCTTENIIESKSLKLYLNSFNLTRFESAGAAADVMAADLGRVAGGRVSVSLFMPEDFDDIAIHAPEGTCIDDEDIEADSYEADPGLLSTGEKRVCEKLHSNLLRTNCPVTGQPDWATVMIEYAGRAIDRKGLLAYIVSFREHTGFHENCVESIYTQIMEKCGPEQLTVYARFTRRGGIDINPFRSHSDFKPLNMRLSRQ